MESLPNVIVTQNFNIIDIAFDLDVPNVVKFHILSIVSNKFVGKMIINKESLESIKRIAVSELENLIVTGQLYYFCGRWQDNCTSLNYNPLNFQ